MKDSILDSDIIREEMEIEAEARRIERRSYRNQRFLNLFPKEKRGKILDIEFILITVPQIIFWTYVIIRVITR